MNVQKVNTQNQTSFGIRSINLDDSLAALSESTVKAIKGAITKETYKIGDNKTDVFLYAELKENENIGKTVGNNFYLYSSAQKNNSECMSIVHFPQKKIKTVDDAVGLIKTSVDKLNEHLKSPSAKILKSAQDLTEKFNK